MLSPAAGATILHLRLGLKKSAGLPELYPVTASPIDCIPAGADPADTQRLDLIGAAPVQVLGVDGDDELSERLASAGLWPGVVVERITSAPFGDPVLFRVQGYRLALRRAEAARVRVVPFDGCPLDAGGSAGAAG